MFFRKSWFISKTAEVMEREFDYRFKDFTYEQRALVRQVCDQVRKRRGNEYDAAILFMLLMIEQLSDDDRVRGFKISWSSRAHYLQDFAALEGTRELIRRNDEKQGRDS